MLLKNIEEYDHIYIACGYTDMRKSLRPSFTASQNPPRQTRKALNTFLPKS